MKNKRGFTLVELLVVIGILGVLIGIAVPSSIGISNRIKEKMYKSKVKTIEVAAGLWADDHKSDCIENYGSLSVQDLIAGGYLKADENGQVTNPNPTSDDNKTLNNKTIRSLDINISSVCSSQLKSTTASGKILSDNVVTDPDTGEITGPVQPGTSDFTKGSPYCEFVDSRGECAGDSISNGTGLYATPDDDGTSYYFRGAKSKLNNNVLFAGQKWKIIRINGDGSIRLIYVNNFSSNSQPLSIGSNMFNDFKYSLSELKREKVGFTYNNEKGKECTKEHPCEVIYDGASFSNTNFGGTSSDVKIALETWYNTNLKSYDNKIAYGLFCNDVSYGSGNDDMSTTSVLNYGASERIKNGSPTLICPDQVDINGEPRTYGGLYKTKIGLITADELNMAGIGSVYAHPAHETNYLYRNGLWWSMSPNDSNIGATVITGNYGRISGINTHNTYYVMPVINLKADVKLTGSGTEDDPYVVED